MIAKGFNSIYEEPEWIIRLITHYQEFKPLYTHLYDLCKNVEGVMNMFSEELKIMDRNTVKYMIDDLQERLDNANEQLDATTEKLNEANSKVDTLIKKLIDNGIDPYN